MDVHLKDLFTRYNVQFGSGPGIGPGSGTCLLKIDKIASGFIESMFRASAALYRTNPWMRLRSTHLFGVRVGKDSDWVGKKQPFSCVQFVGGCAEGGDLGFHLFRSEADAKKCLGFNETVRVPGVEFLRVVYEVEVLLVGCNRRMVKSLSLEASGGDRYSLIDVARCSTMGGVGFRNPTIEELRFVYGFMKGMCMLHSLLEEDRDSGPKWSRVITFKSFIETVDVQWPMEMVSSHGFDVVAVTITHPPSNNVYKEKGSGTRTRTRTLSPTPSKYSDSPKEEEVFSDGIVNWGSGNRKCAMCEDEINVEMSISCGRCRGVVYCGDVCKRNHSKEIHKSMCGLYTAMMERGEELAMKIFKFPCLAEDPCKWLETLGTHRKGMWRRMCNCFSHCPFGMLPVTSFSDSWGGLSEGEYSCDLSISGPTPILLSGWPEYYNLRFLPLSSPVATILSYPLTLYHILMTLNISSKSLFLEDKEVIVHYLGPEGELDWMPAFAEIGYLLNGLGNLQIVMVGPEVPPNLSGNVLGISSRVRVNFVSGVYQDEVTYLPSPDVVVALNCGLESYANWGGALDLINSMNVPAFFTEASEISCANVKQVLRDARLHITHPVTPNPFRSPLSNQGLSNNLPSYSNGFVFGVNT
ncbi:hypothetical protein GIB67_011436 [Kingdonia uniflora]|uniref:MYND-type domain-containing protein n=1 Tax=Kingdonia uniflora TaxID=39325 RepID=A0A7J7NLC6_9MAGN|nr:hypothetical protein GIB67_011436 [Kingdonia uniflora]